MEKETINWLQLVKYLNNPQDTALEQEVRQWTAASPENEAAFLQVQQLWQLSPDLKILEQLDTAAAIARLQDALPEEEIIHQLPARRYRWFRVAAIAIPVMAAASWWLYHSAGTISYREKATLAAIDSLLLPDQSRIYLDTNSRIRYPESMRKNRTVIMEQGTAFFNVASQTATPFIVKIGRSSITVLGTAFNIRMEEQRIGVTVKTGKIKFASGHTNATETILSAGEGIRFDPATGDVEQFNAINSNADAWITHELVFVDAPLSEVCKKVEALYQVKINLQGKIPVKKLNATFKNNKLEEVLEVLQATYPITVVHRNREITITGR
ncbi:ferric-dicitrate binding protein FerR, regulates iron transport through sigma-19 [Chitinophaga eiseniae]|uniref:Ferric-dicitrate binding protein FerR, regulates iron transport through sigma-19 n=1 Tax=Chitinophaga eiseniae TaxID=634771 RepID=A0A1T4KIJ1_9BACT|nr:FecR domain-containing protein [Chitinophaga eiseniae]SJZ42239.1 ferric-dicitrate binding protein FerR, regulates iron transport through sigma-19 [Chitinophaga eiseniae]